MRTDTEQNVRRLGERASVILRQCLDAPMPHVTNQRCSCWWPAPLVLLSLLIFMCAMIPIARTASFIEVESDCVPSENIIVLTITEFSRGEDTHGLTSSSRQGLYHRRQTGQGPFLPASSSHYTKTSTIPAPAVPRRHAHAESDDPLRQRRRVPPPQGHGGSSSARLAASGYARSSRTVRVPAHQHAHTLSIGSDWRGTNFSVHAMLSGGVPDAVTDSPTDEALDQRAWVLRVLDRSRYVLADTPYQFKSMRSASEAASVVQCVDCQSDEKHNWILRVTRGPTEVQDLVRHCSVRTSRSAIARGHLT